MIKVIERGPKEFIAYCPRCGAKISYELEDLRAVFGTQVYIINCPECQTVINHGSNKNLFDN